MKIADSHVQVKTAYRMESGKETAEKLTVWKDKPDTGANAAYVVNIGSSAQYRSYTAQKTQSCSETDSESVDDQNANLMLKLIESMIYQLTGRTVKLQSPLLHLDTSQPEVAMNNPQPEAQNERDGWGLIYEYRQSVTQTESVAYSAAGTITTDDGRAVSFEMNFKLSREYVEQHSLSLRMGDAARVDPLVVVLNGNAPSLTTQKQGFDINSDGTLEQISFATNGSGFLALDKNGDKQINDGSELFGLQSGNGFSDLRAYDEDGDGWIDESDDVFKDLSILSSDAAGHRTLVKLGEAGIGAIYLQSAATPYSIKDGSKENGTIRSSSVYLKEDGTPGTIHHVDLAL